MTRPIQDVQRPFLFASLSLFAISQITSLLSYPPSSLFFALSLPPTSFLCILTLLSSLISLFLLIFSPRLSPPFFCQPSCHLFIQVGAVMGSDKQSRFWSYGAFDAVPASSMVKRLLLLLVEDGMAAMENSWPGQQVTRGHEAKQVGKRVCCELHAPSPGCMAPRTYYHYHILKTTLTIGLDGIC